MSIKLTLEISADSIEDVRQARMLLESYESIMTKEEVNVPVVQPQSSLDHAVKECSWEVVHLAVLLLLNQDGVSEKGVYAFFETLSQANTGSRLTERAISSRVGRTAIICKKLNVPQLMTVGTRRKDQAKRVYLTHEAKESLVRLLKGRWGEEFNAYLREIGQSPMRFDSL